jgi:protein-S-isoprenylcysteine O-methyltransferase Ste14
MPRSAPIIPTADQAIRLIVRFAVSMAVIAFLLFVPAGTLWWPRGLWFLGIMLGASLVVFALLWRVNPEIFVARMSIKEGTKAWDRRLILFLTIAFAAILPIAALDDVRFHWSNVPDWVSVLGNLIFLLGLAIVVWAEAVNRFFEPGVRIQTERGHTVIDTGPYAFVRHPGYASTLLLLPGVALALGSYWALLPAAAGIVLLVVRTLLEEATLRAELDGYETYTQRVRFRWIPGVW